MVGIGGLVGPAAHVAELGFVEEAGVSGEHDGEGFLVPAEVDVAVVVRW